MREGESQRVAYLVLRSGRVGPSFDRFLGDSEMNAVINRDRTGRRFPSDLPHQISTLWGG